MKTIYILVQLVQITLQWVESEDFECYMLHGLNPKSSKSTGNVLESCFKAKHSKYYMGCLAVVDERGLIYTGCADRYPEFRYLCIPNIRRRGSYLIQDSLGVSYFDKRVAQCCREARCNNGEFLQNFTRDSTLLPVNEAFESIIVILRLRLIAGFLVSCAVGAIFGLAYLYYAKITQDDRWMHLNYYDSDEEDTVQSQFNKMLPFVYNPDDDNSRAEANSNSQERGIEEYYMDYEKKQANSRFYRDRVGIGQQHGYPPLPSNGQEIESIQHQMRQTEQALQRLNEEKQLFHQPPPTINEPNMAHAPIMAQLPPTLSQPPPNFSVPPPTTYPAYQQQVPQLTGIPPPISSMPAAPRKPDESRRKRSRERDRRRSRSRSKERRRRRSRTRSRSREHRRRRDHRSRSRSRTRSPPSRYSSKKRRSRSASRDREFDEDDWNPGIPSNKLAILNMPSDVDNVKITLALGKSGYLPQDVRTMTKFDKVTKQIRTFAFVEFSDIAVATKWMDENQGYLYLDDGRRVVVEYAKGDHQSGSSRREDDWICANCSMNNFVKRQNCFKCDISKEQSFDLEKQGMHMVGVAACDTLLIRQLPENCDPCLIYSGLHGYNVMNSINMVKVSDSKRYAFVHMKSTDEAIVLLNLIYRKPLKLGDKDVQVTYCRDSLSKSILHQVTNLLQVNGPTPPANQESMSGAAVAEKAISKAQIARDTSNQIGQMLSSTSYPPPAPQSMMVPNAQYTKGVIGSVTLPNGSVHPRYVVPNPAGFLPDTNSGYYMDPITTFLYDTNTGYYFNNDSKVWCVYDMAYQTYFTVEQQQQPQSQQPSTEVTTEVKEKEATAEKKKSDGPKKAEDIQKEMEKWRRKQEKKKIQMSIKAPSKALETKNVFHEKKKMAPILGDDDDDDEVGEAALEPSSSTTLPAPTQRKGPSAKELREAMERALVDESKLMCLLCKRAFPSVDILRKHVNKSDMHRGNLEKKRIEWGKQYAETLEEEERNERKEPEMPKIVYRDRAKERRQQYGIDAAGYAFDVMGGKESAAKSEEAIRRESELAAARPIDNSNIGNRLLKNMGWKEGEGVGKNGQGIVNPIQAERFVLGAGLGSAGSKIRGGVEASHKEKTKAALYSRFNS
ncbi:unnamed protein product [Caenorhabditis bovis]|uniref:RNA-binding protein 5 n=1 Tax=Caenorhabditis bovis TaxID=2654633 RepID=A0A8S1F760_9PELO|nr:unnamed protein product [Caenorhabditis bovis]